MTNDLSRTLANFHVDPSAITKINGETTTTSPLDHVCAGGVSSEDFLELSSNKEDTAWADDVEAEEEEEDASSVTTPNSEDLIPTERYNRTGASENVNATSYGGTDEPSSPTTQPRQPYTHHHRHPNLSSMMGSRRAYNRRGRRYETTHWTGAPVGVWGRRNNTHVYPPRPTMNPQQRQHPQQRLNRLPQSVEEGGANTATLFTDSLSHASCPDLPARVITIDLQLCLYNGKMHPREYAICLIINGEIIEFDHGLIPSPVELNKLSAAEWHQNRYLTRDVHQLSWNAATSANAASTSMTDIIARYGKLANNTYNRVGDSYCFVIRGKQKETYLRNMICADLPIVTLEKAFPLNCIPCKYHIYSPYTNRRCALFNLNFINSHVIDKHYRQICNN